MEIAIKDFMYFLVLVVGVIGSHFMLRARVMVLEERSRNHNDQFQQILSALKNLEDKIDHKADR
ncbi:MAG: hypothetical protein ABJE63_10000 [Lentilitoribacter sp.]|jgi:hypothetical protein